MSRCHASWSAVAFYLFTFALAAMLAGVPPAHAAKGDCSQPLTNGANPTASDCLFILKTAVGTQTCDPVCVCNTNGSGGVTASDALVCLKKAVGQPVTLSCPCITQEAALFIAANPDPARPGEAVDVQITATNTGSVDLLDVVVDMVLPQELADFALVAVRGAAAQCIGASFPTFCSPGEKVQWTLGTLAPGAVAVLTLPAPIDTDPIPANGTDVTFHATVSASASQLGAADATVTVDSERQLDLALDEDIDPVVPGGTVLYRLSFGNPSAALSQETVLRMPIPTGVSFVAASDGGSLVTGNVVEWTLGTLSPGETAGRELIVEADGFGPDGGAIVASAELENQDGVVVDASTVTEVRGDVPLAVTLSLSPDPVEPGATVQGTVSVANTGAVDLLGVTVEVPLPQEVGSFVLVANSGAAAQCIGASFPTFCSPTETLQWTVGTIAAGASVTLTMQPLIDAAATPGAIASFEARARDDSGLDVGARESLRIVDTRLLDLSVDDSVDPVAPDGVLTYELTFGNRGAVLGENAVLRIPLPPGVTFISASDGGVVGDDQVAEWDIGTLSPGQTGKRELVVQARDDLEDGTVLSVEAQLDVTSGERARATADTRVQAGVPLVLRMQLNSDPSQTGEFVQGVLTVTNTGLVELIGVEVELLLPEETGDFALIGVDGATSQCIGASFPTFCSATERLLWSVGSLAAGTGNTLTVPVLVKDGTAAGSVMTFEARARSSTGDNIAITDSVRVEETRLIELALDDGNGDAVAAGDTITYRLSFGNPSAVLAQDTVLTLALPAGVTFVDATDGGTLGAGNVVQWNVGTLNPGNTGLREAIVQTDAGLIDGTVVSAKAHIDASTGERTRARADTRIEGGIPLVFTMELNSDPSEAGEFINGVLTVTNTGAVALNEVAVEVILPQETGDFVLVGVDGASAQCLGASFPTFCSATERLVWTVGTIAAGSGVSLTMPALVKAGIAAGTVMTFEARARDNSGHNLALSDSVRIETSRLLELSLDDGDGDSVAPGDAITYRLSFGNPTAVLAQDAALELPLPAGVTFVSASDGGTLQDDLVQWDVGTLNPGDTGTREVVVQTDAGLIDGAIVSAQAHMDVSTGQRTRARADTRVEAGVPLVLTMVLNPDPAETAGVPKTVQGVLTVTNTGLVALTSVEVEVLLPQEIGDFALIGVSGAAAQCAGASFPTFCSATERLVWTVGALAAGAGLTLTMPPFAKADVADGTVITFEARARASGGNNVASRASVRIEGKRLVDLALDDGDGSPVSAGEQVTYTLTFGNPTATVAANTVLRMTPPAGTSFVSASDFGAVGGDGVVEWTVGTLNPGDGETRTLTVQVDGDLADGAVIRAAAEIDDDSGKRTRATADTRVETDTPLELTLALDPVTPTANEVLDGTLVASNTGPVTLTSVEVEVLIPDQVANFNLSSVTGATAACAGASFPTFCQPTERIVWTVGSLAAGADVTLTMPPPIAAAVASGTVVTFEARARASGGSNAAVRQSVRVVSP